MAISNSFAFENTSSNARTYYKAPVKTCTEAWKFHARYPTVLKSHSAFGGGLILVGHDGERKDLRPRPDAAETVDDVGRPSPLETQTNYVGVRHLQKDEVQKLEGKMYAPTIQQRADDVKETLRPTDTLNHPEWRHGPHQTIAPPGGSHENVDCFDTERERKQRNAAFPAMTSNVLYNQYCENLMEDGPKTPVLMNMNRKWDAKIRWLKQLPPTIDDLPIFTIRVRWKLSPNLPCYSLELVHALISRHGRILAMGRTAPNAAMVVFSDVETARRVIKCCKGVTSPVPLICSWWFPEMCSYNRMIHEQKMREVKRSLVILKESAILRLEFKKIQEKCQIQFKKYQGSLSYDRNTFVP